MSLTPKEFLLASTDPQGRVLFRSGSELARRIAAIPYLTDFERANDYFEKAQTAVSYVNRIFRDGSAPSDGLRMAIIQAVGDRLEGGNDEVRKRFMKQADRVLRGPASQAADPRQLEVVDRALGKAMEAKEIWCVYTGIFAGGDLQTFSHVFVKRLGLAKQRYTEPEARFVVLFPTEEAAAQSWLGAFAEMVGRTGVNDDCPIFEDHEEAANVLAAREQSDHLRVFVVPPGMTTVPTVVIDPQDDVNAYGVVAFARDGVTGSDDPLVYEMPAAYVRNWRQRVLQPVLFGTIDVKRSTFASLRDVVMSEVKSGRPIRDLPRTKVE